MGNEQGAFMDSPNSLEQIIQRYNDQILVGEITIESAIKKVKDFLRSNWEIQRKVSYIPEDELFEEQYYAECMLSGKEFDL